MKNLREKKENTSGADPQVKDKRKWLRFEFASPVVFRLISPEEGEPKFEANLEREGRILDISAGGVLLATNKPTAEESFISLNLNLKGLKKLQGILGKVKRVEESEQGDFLMGVEFCPIEAYPRLYQKTLAEKDIQSFDKKVKQAISRHLLAEYKKVKARIKV
jgi:hypothetical protein